MCNSWQGLFTFIFHTRKLMHKEVNKLALSHRWRSPLRSQLVYWALQVSVLQTVGQLLSLKGEVLEAAITQLSEDFHGPSDHNSITRSPLFIISCDPLGRPVE